MSDNKTPDQKFADRLDCELYRLILRAETRGRKERHWVHVATALRQTRSLIRIRMHPKDREITV